MNDMSGHFDIAERLDQDYAVFGRMHGPSGSRLTPPRAFAEATARVEDALQQLRAAETALERQLNDLRAYMRTAPGLSASPSTSLTR